MTLSRFPWPNCIKVSKYILVLKNHSAIGKFCAYTRHSYQVSIYRTFGPLVLFSDILPIDIVFLVLYGIISAITVVFAGKYISILFN